MLDTASTGQRHVSPPACRTPAPVGPSVRVAEGAVARRRVVARRAAVAAAFLSLLVPTVAAGESTSWFWRVRGFHQTDSGGDTRVSLYGSEVGGGVSRGPWRVELTVPALVIDGPGTFVGPGLGVGTIVDRGHRGSGSDAVARSNGTPGSGPGGSAGSGAGPGSGTSTSHMDWPTVVDDGERSGLGDVRVSVRRLLGRDGPWGRVSLLGGVKLPTADESEALGTGETDGWLGLGWYRQGWTVDLTAYAEWVELGESDVYDLDSGPAGGIFAVWPVRSIALEGGVEVAASMVPGADTRSWAVASVTGPAGASLAWRLETFYGLSDSATDVGVTFTLAPR